MDINQAKVIFNQQYGFSTWRNCDIAVKRLRCSKENYYTHVLPQYGFDEYYFKDTPIFACKFSPQEGNEHLVALANEEGKLAIHDTDRNSRHGIHAHNNAIFDLAWMFDQMKLVTASGDHTSKLYSITNSDIREERVFCGHKRSVKTVAFRKDDPSVFASGGRDGDIILWDTRTNVNNFVGKIDKTIPNSHIDKTALTPSKMKKKFYTPSQFVKSVTGLVFQDQNTLISCGAGDGIIKVWDLRKNYVTYKREALPKSFILYPGNTSRNGYSNIILDNESTKLYANCLDNTIYCFNVGTYNNEPIMKYTGHQNNTFYVKSSLYKNGDYLVSGSSDENAYIWNTKYSYPIVKLVGHRAEVTSVAWRDNNMMLITCSDDTTHRIWTVGPDEIPENWEFLGKGFVEVLPKIDNNTIKVKLKRSIMSVPETITPKKTCMECERCSSKSSCRFCENCNVTSTKRKNPSELCNENKRLHTEFGPRRLFGNVNNIISEESESLATSLDSNEGHVNSDDWEPPNKISKLSNSPSTSCANVILSSPTVNLPNYNLDGTAPHLNYSPPKKKNCDWLTKLRKENSLRKEIYERTVGPSSPKAPKLDSTPKTSKSTPKSPLLRFFKVTNNSLKCDNINCSKPQGFISNVQPNQ